MVGFGAIVRKLVLLMTGLLILHVADGQQLRPLDIDEGATQVALIVEAQSGEVVYEYDSHRRVTPASLTKLITTAAVLSEKGSQETFVTDIYWDEKVKALAIVGRGDPTMESRYFPECKIERVATAIADGIGDQRDIETMVIDVSYLKGAKYNSKRLWEDMGNYYGAAWNAVNVADNSFKLTLSSPQKIGGLCRVVSVEPSVTKDVVSYVESYSKGADSAYIYGTESGTMYVSGAIPAGRAKFDVKGANPSPEILFGELLKSNLNSKGISIGDIEVRRLNVQKTGKLIANVKSPTLATIARETNMKSINLFADALVMKLGEENGSTSWDRSMKRLNDYIEQESGEKGMLYDGSGLSPMNKVTASQVVSVLRAMGNGGLGKQYKATLAVAGKSGTLARFCKGTNLEGRLIGKSGSMTGVRGYAGYVRTRENIELVFCIIVNNSELKAKEIVNKIERWFVECGIN